MSGSCQASEQYADQLEDLLECACAKRIAGFIAEPIQVRTLDGVCVCVYVCCLARVGLSQVLPLL